MSQESIEIGGKEYPLNVQSVTIEEWLEMIACFNRGDSNAASEKIMRLVLKVLGPAGNKISIVYLPLLIPRVMEKIASVITPGDIENEISEILRRQDPSNS